MWLKELDLFDWRNFHQDTLNLGEGLNYIHGPNGSGKTNLLEAAAYLAYARSFRKTSDKGLINSQAKAASIKGTFVFGTSSLTKTVEARLEDGAKQVKVDGKKVDTLSSFMGTILVSVFDPRDVFLFKGEPSERRKVMDETLSAISPNYLYSLQRYKKLLRERNQALAQRSDSEVLGVLTNELLASAYRITQERLGLVRFVDKTAPEYFQKLFGDGAKLSFKYRTNSSISDSLEIFRKEMLFQFERRKSQEAIRRATVIGPHLDDLSAYLDGNSLASYGSQGQNRLASLSLTLSLAALMKEKKGEAPILILDDVMSDLDGEKKKRLLDTIAPMGQSLISGNDKDLPESALSIGIQAGKVVHEKERD